MILLDGLKEYWTMAQMSRREADPKARRAALSVLKQMATVGQPKWLKFVDLNPTIIVRSRTDEDS